MTTPFADQIQARADSLNREIEAALASVKKLEADRDELLATIVTLRKHNLVPPAPRSQPRVPINGETTSTQPKPTVPEMILRVLDRDYPDGAEPNQVLTRIKERFDENADPNNVRPTMWRMAKDGRLEKHGDKYRLPRKNEAAGTPSESAPTASAQEHPTTGVFS